MTNKPRVWGHSQNIKVGSKFIKCSVNQMCASLQKKWENHLKILGTSSVSRYHSKSVRRTSYVKETWSFIGRRRSALFLLLKIFYWLISYHNFGASLVFGRSLWLKLNGLHVGWWGLCPHTPPLFPCKGHWIICRQCYFDHFGFKIWWHSLNNK